jgi:hypothetical protein
MALEELVDKRLRKSDIKDMDETPHEDLELPPPTTPDNISVGEAQPCALPFLDQSSLQCDRLLSSRN